jgi:general stress protein YciG
MAGKLSDYLAKIGSKGGKATGPTKRRGDKTYYQKIGSKGGKRKAADAGTERRRAAEDKA